MEFFTESFSKLNDILCPDNIKSGLSTNPKEITITGNLNMYKDNNFKLFKFFLSNRPWDNQQELDFSKEKYFNYFVNYLFEIYPKTVAINILRNYRNISKNEKLDLKFLDSKDTFSMLNDTWTNCLDNTYDDLLSLRTNTKFYNLKKGIEFLTSKLDDKDKLFFDRKGNPWLYGFVKSNYSDLGYIIRLSNKRRYSSIYVNIPKSLLKRGCIVDLSSKIKYLNYSIPVTSSIELSSTETSSSCQASFLVRANLSDLIDVGYLYKGSREIFFNKIEILGSYKFTGNSFKKVIGLF